MRKKVFLLIGMLFVLFSEKIEAMDNAGRNSYVNAQQQQAASQHNDGGFRLPIPSEDKNDVRKRKEEREQLLHRQYVVLRRAVAVGCCVACLATVLTIGGIGYSVWTQDPRCSVAK